METQLHLPFVAPDDNLTLWWLFSTKLWLLVTCQSFFNIISYLITESWPFSKSHTLSITPGQWKKINLVTRICG